MEQRKRSSTRIWKWVLGIALAIVMLIGAGAWYLSQKWRPLLDKQLKQLVIAASDSLYHIEYSYFDINMVSGNAELKDFKLIPDSVIYKKLVSEGKAPDNVYQLNVEALNLRSFHPRQLYSENKLNINSIVIDRPVLVITNRRLPFNETDTVKDKRTLYQMVSKVFKEVRVGKIDLRDIDFTFLNKSNRQEKKTAIRNLNISVRDLLIDSLSKNSKEHLYSRDVGVVMRDYQIATPDSLYYLKFDKFSFSSSDQRVSLDNISLTPRYKITEFYKRAKYAKDRFDINFNNVSINNIDIRRFVRDQKLYASSMDMKKASVEVYNNNSYPKRKTDRTGKFPHQQLQGLALDLKIDTIRLRNTYISYSEHDKTSGKTGKISFERTEGRFYNVTNDSAALAKNHIMKADLNTRVFNSGNLNINFAFNLTDKLGGFSYSGILGPVNGRNLNRITEPLGMISVKSANIKRLKFSARANQDVARGNVEFVYDDLKVQILKRDETTGDLKKQGFISGIANTFVIHSSNPDKKGRLTPGVIYYQRPVTQSFFSFLWNSLFTGVKGSVGVDREKETKIRKTVTNVGNFLQNLKDNAAEHKRKREERRLERKKEKEAKSEN